MRRVVVTGLGAVTPIGGDAPSTWRAAVAGRERDRLDHRVRRERVPGSRRCRGEGLRPDRRSRRRRRRAGSTATSCSRSAPRARPSPTRTSTAPTRPTRVGILFGTAIGGIAGIVEQAEVLRERGPDRVAPTFIPNVLVDTASGQLAIATGFRGPNYAPVSACATGSTAVGEAAELIKRGDADAVLAGGSEACLTPLILAGFCAMRGLAAEDEHPPRASRPFDATRAGFVMGEGACVLVLEELEAAQTRGATIYAEILGYAMSNDAHHLAQPDPDSTGVAEMMRRALERAAVEPERVGYINAHGTSTPLGDAAETKAIKDVFGDHAYELAVSSTKSVTGHCFGAAGAIEAMMCVLAVRDGVLPPTMNYVHPDPDCDLDYVPNEARHAQVDVALSNAMGLGGHNGCVLIGRV